VWKSESASGFTSREDATATLRAIAGKSDIVLLYVTPERIVKSKRLLGQLEKVRVSHVDGTRRL
jgi:hemin uptake protein HemP